MEKITLQLLSKEEQDRIHAASLEILEQVGMAVMDAEALELLAGAGAQVDFAAQRVRFPASLIQHALAKAPSEVKLYGRDINQVVHLRQGGVYYSTSGYAVWVYDPATGKRRAMGKEDLAWVTRLADGLDQVDIYALLGTPVDAPPETNDRYQLAIALANTRKHIWNTAYGKEGVEDAVRMASAVRGSPEALRQYPLFTLDLTTLSPLQLDERQASTMIAGARHRDSYRRQPGSNRRRHRTGNPGWDAHAGECRIPGRVGFMPGCPAGHTGDLHPVDAQPGYGFGQRGNGWTGVQPAAHRYGGDGALLWSSLAWRRHDDGCQGA